MRSGQQVTAEENIAYGRSRIAGYKLPKLVDFIVALPRNAADKVLRRSLREPYWIGRERRVGWFAMMSAVVDATALKAEEQAVSEVILDFSKGQGDDPWTMPLTDMDVSNPRLFASDTIWPFFERLRRDDPVHWCDHGLYGPYWSITKYNDIMTVETAHQVFSSQERIGKRDAKDDFYLPMFIAMDPPKHDQQRKTVMPIVSPANLARLEGTIRERAMRILDGLPIGETFDWVDRVSIEITTQMLATLFDFPFEDRRKLTRWSDVATASQGSSLYTTEGARRAELMECLQYFTLLWNDRVNAEPRPDLISMMAHSDATRDMTPHEFLGNLILLIVGGNDTTRNSISGGLLALNENPDQYQKLRENPALIESMVPEIIRWQTPIAHMRRRATADFELRGKTIRKGDKVLMWYVSGNRDEEAIERPNDFIIERTRPRQHVSFGFGIHRCVGSRLAEMQLHRVGGNAKALPNNRDRRGTVARLLKRYPRL